MNGWMHKDVWKYEGRNFCVEISRHEVSTREEHYGEGPHRWCVYAYVYPKHPRFAEFDAARPMYEQPSFGMHAGVSYFRAHRNDAGEVRSFQIGCDYNHLHDDHYTRMATADDARSVFNDADEIVEMLRNTDAQQ